MEDFGVLVVNFSDDGVCWEFLTVLIMEFYFEVGEKLFDFFATGKDTGFFSGDCGMDFLRFYDGLSSYVRFFEVEFFEVLEEFLVFWVVHEVS